MDTLHKYPRTSHLPWSEGVTSDDKIIRTTDAFIGKRVIVTEKMDGENTSIYANTVHARSVDGRGHVSRDWVKNFARNFQHMLPDNRRVCGENLYAKHSIEYDDLESYFLGFSYWNGEICSSWTTTMAVFGDLGITPVPVLYDGIYDEKAIQALWNDNATSEGYVVRLEAAFLAQEFNFCVAKFVRNNHVQTDKHWMSQAVVPNKLKGE